LRYEPFVGSTENVTGSKRGNREEGGGREKNRGRERKEYGR